MKTHIKTQQKYLWKNNINQNLGFPNKFHLQYKNKVNYLKDFTLLDALNKKSRPVLFCEKRASLFFNKVFNKRY